MSRRTWTTDHLYARQDHKPIDHSGPLQIMNANADFRVQLTLPKSKAKWSLFSLLLLLLFLTPRKYKFLLSWGFFFSPNGFDLGRVDCCKKGVHKPSPNPVSFYQDLQVQSFTLRGLPWSGRMFLSLRGKIGLIWSEVTEKCTLN